MAGHSISNCLAWTLSTEAQSQSCCVQHSGAFTAGVRPIWGCWISRTKSREGSLKERLDTGSGMMKQSEGLRLQKGMPWDTNNVRSQRETVHQKEAAGQRGGISSVTGSW